MKRIPEVLAPAGSFESMVAAINAGCNAVYVGGKEFSARAYASNFDTDELLKAIDYCHLRGVKIYLTVNTLFKEKEITPLMYYVNDMYQGGMDALIVQDFGTAMHIKKHFKDFELHASTQMTIHQLKGVEFLKEQGFSRVVLNREATLGEISHIIEQSDMEIECFVHGALCYAYSGQCLMSSILGGRSGNRGRCAGTCRLPYDLIEDGKRINHHHGRYLLSPKDIATLDLIPELIAAGIHSYKIEGRMKSPEYVAAVTSMYRKYVDLYLTDGENYRVDERDRKMLLELYNRGGFSKGYYVDKKHEIMSMKKPNHQGVRIGSVETVFSKEKRIKIKVAEQVRKGDTLEIWTGHEPLPRINLKDSSNNGILTIKIDSRGISKGQQVYRTRSQQTYEIIREEIIRAPLKKLVSCEVEMVKDKPLKLMLSYKDIYICVEGDMVQQAIKQSLTKERLRKQLKKTGDYPFDIQITHINMDDDSFVPIGLINQVRRDALDRLSKAIITPYKRASEIITEPLSKPKPTTADKIEIYTLIRSVKQYETVAKYPITGIYLESEFFNLEQIERIVSECTKQSKRVYIAMPRIYNQEEEEQHGKFLQVIMTLDVTGYLIRTYGEYQIVRNLNKDKILDYNMNIFNGYSVEAWQELGASRVTLSPELHRREIEVLPSESTELLIYGYLPLMVTKQCVVNNATRDKTICYNKKKYALNDRYNKNFYVDRRCNRCMNVIYNSSPMILFDQLEKIKALGQSHLRLEFTTETENQIAKLLALTFDLLEGKKMSTEEILINLDMGEFNRGHFMRGIE